jgi:tripartite-type tricarboxylate transporter receptor subunit TctC
MFRYLVVLAVFGLTQPVSAQDYPSRPITVVIPFTPGGPLDFLLRTIKEKFEKALGQQILIEDRPGQTGIVGSAYAAKAAPDGYTLLMTSANNGMFPHIFRNLPHDPIKDFVPVGEVAQTPEVIVVHPSSRFQTLADLIKEAKENPGKVRYGSSGNGTPSHIITEYMGKLNGVKFVHVPYKNSLESLDDVMQKSLDFVCTGLSGRALPLIREGKMKPIAVIGNKRSSQLPDVPTVKEAGFGDVEEVSRYILVAPAKTPKPIIDRLSVALTSVLADQAVQKVYIERGFEIAHSTPAEVSAAIQHEYDFWGPVLKELNLKIDASQ